MFKDFIFFLTLTVPKYTFHLCEYLRKITYLYIYYLFNYYKIIKIIFIKNINSVNINISKH